MIHGFNIKKMGKAVSISIPLFYLGRAAAACFALVYLTEYPYFTIITFNYFTLLSLIVEWWNWPRKDFFEQAQVILNEITLLLMCYHLFCLTEFVDVTMRMLYIGNSVLIMILLNLVVFVVFIVVPLTLTTMEKIRKRRLRIKQKAYKYLIRIKKSYKKVKRRIIKKLNPEVPMIIKEEKIV